MAEIKRYVCTASTAGGDGTTSATTGANRAYASLEECMNANEQDLTDNGGDTFVVEITGDCSTADTTAVTIHNYTTSATCYINIYTTSTARHKGKWSTSYYRIHYTGLTPLSTCYVNSHYVKITGLQFLYETNSGTQGRRVVSLIGDYITFKSNICYVIDNNGNTMYGLELNDSDNTYLINNVVYGTNMDYGIDLNNSGVSYLYNNTIYGATSIGIHRQAGNPVGINNISYGSGLVDYDVEAAWNSTLTTNNLSSDDTAPRNNTVKSATLTFTNTSNGDFHLISSDTAAIDAGADISVTFTDDIDGQTRSGTWDIGADEYVSATTTTNRLLCLLGTGV